MQNAESNVITDKISKRNREDANETTEPCAKVIKLMDSDIDVKRYDMIASFLSDLATYQLFETDPVMPEKHESQTECEKIDIDAEIEQRVASRIEEMQHKHNDEVAKLQQKISQQDKLNQTYTAEIEKWKQNHGDLSEKYENLVKKQETNMLALQQSLADKNEADQNNLKVAYEGRLSDLQNKCDELQKSAEKQREEIALRDSSIAMYTQELQKAHSINANYKKHCDTLQSNYNQLFKRENHYSQQNSMLLTYNTQYQAQLKGWEDKFNALKKESEAMITKLQYDRNGLIERWKEEQKARTELTSQMELMKQENNTRISQMRQELLMKVKNQATVPTPVASPVLIPESTSTPPPSLMPINAQKTRHCKLCNKICRMAFTISLCNDNCKQEYL